MDVPTAPRSSTPPTSVEATARRSRISRFRKRIVVQRAPDGRVSLEERPGLIGLQRRRCSSTRLHRCRCNATVAWFRRAVRFACRCRRTTSASGLALRRCRPPGRTVSRMSENLRRPLPDAPLAPLGSLFPQARTSGTIGGTDASVNVEQAARVEYGPSRPGWDLSKGKPPHRRKPRRNSRFLDSMFATSRGEIALSSRGCCGLWFDLILGPGAPRLNFVVLGDALPQSPPGCSTPRSTAQRSAVGGVRPRGRPGCFHVL